MVVVMNVVVKENNKTKGQSFNDFSGHVQWKGDKAMVMMVMVLMIVEVKEAFNDCMGRIFWNYNADDEVIMMMILVVMVEANKGAITFGPNPVKVWLMEMVFFNLNFKVTWTPYFDVIVQSQKEKELRF